MRMSTLPGMKWIGFGLGVGLAMGALSARAGLNPMEGADIAAGAKWGACINVAETENSDVFEFLSQVIAHERLDRLAERARWDWRVDLDTLKTVSVYGADEDWGAVTLVARGDFSSLDFSGVPQESAPWRGKYSIHRYAPLAHINLLFVKYSDGVLVGADTLEGVRRALDVLDGVRMSHAQFADQPAKLRNQFASSVCVMGLNVDELKQEVDLKSALLQGTSQAWFTLQEKGYEVQADIHMDHASSAAASGAVETLEKVFKQAFDTDTTPAVIMDFLDALSTRVEGNWVTAQATGSTWDMVQMLSGLQDLLNGN